MPTDRQAKLAEIRRQILAGTYETPERLAAAVDALWYTEFAPNFHPTDLTSENLLENRETGKGSFGGQPFRE